jgi:hypothetical protein
MTHRNGFHVVRTTASHAVILCIALILFLASGTAAAGPKLYRNVYGVTPNNVASLHSYGYPVAIDGDTAIVSSAGGVYVMQNPKGWGFGTVAKLTDGGGLVAISHDTAVVAPDWTEVDVFERNQGGPDAWGPLTQITHVPSAMNPSLALDGDTLVVGIQKTFARCSEGAVNVYDRNTPAANAWGLVAELTPPAGSCAFGSSVSVSGDTILVGTLALGSLSQTPHSCPYCQSGGGYVFERNRGGQNHWGQVTALPRWLSGTSVQVAIDGDTAVVAMGWEYIPPSGPDPDDQRFVDVQIFQRQPGTDTWIPSTTLGLIPARAPSIALSGDRLAVLQQSNGYRLWPSWVSVYARNQMAPDLWYDFGADALTITGQSLSFGSAVAMSGASVLVGDPGYVTGSGPTGAAFVFVSDIDGDGLTDNGLDPCPQDPLNDVAGGCRRSLTASPVVDGSIATTHVNTYATNGTYFITATFKNTGSTAILHPFFSVAELSGGNLLENGDGGPYGEGATLSPDVGNGIWEPGETTRVLFVIRLASTQAFRFVVHVQGDIP